MNLRPSIRQLQYMLALYETGNFRKAADMCCVGQSTISIAMRELETQWGVVLFERNNRRVQPSVECERLIDRVRRILVDIDAMVARAKGADSIFIQPQRLGVIHTIAPYFLPRALPMLQRRWPRMQLFLREGQTARLLDELDHNKLDVLIMAFPYQLGAHFSSELMGTDSFWLAMPTGHDLADKASLGVGDIPVKNLLLLEDGHCLREHVKDACMLDNSKANQAFSGTSLDTLMHMVILGMGVTLLPHMAIASPLLSHPDLVFRPLHADLPARQIGLVWRKTSAHACEYTRMAGALRSLLEKGAQDSWTGPARRKTPVRRKTSAKQRTATEGGQIRVGAQAKREALA